MEFIKHLEEVGRGKGIVPPNHAFRAFNWISINDYLKLSIQASYAHYCEPRLTLDDINQYTTMEFALLWGEDRHFVSVSDILSNFSRLGEIEKYFEYSVYADVPINLIDDLYKELTNKD